MRAYHVAVRGFNFKLMTYQKVISAPLCGKKSSKRMLVKKIWYEMVFSRQTKLRLIWGKAVLGSIIFCSARVNPHCRKKQNEPPKLAKTKPTRQCSSYFREYRELARHLSSFYERK